jgi:anionic cell wall polymer biosynthesis LytR-Cps2A-Psr (LCP) family protein
MKKNIIIYIAIIGFLVIGLAAAGIVAILALRGATNPLQNKNEINPTYASFPTENQEQVFTTPIILNPTATEKPLAADPSGTPVDQASEEIATPTVTSVSTSTSFCGFTGQMNLLIIGQDEGLGMPPYGADAIRIIKLDFDQNKASIFAFQRDIRLSTPNLQTTYGISEAHLGSIYDIIMKREGARSDAKQLATNAIAQVLVDNFGIAPDFYVNLNQYVVPSVIDQVGGIDIVVPNDFTTDTHSFVTGAQHLDGAAAWDYLSYPASDQNEWDRLARQDLVFTALRGKLIDPSIFGNLLNLYATVSNSVFTDLNPEQIGGLICEMEQIPPENVAFSTFPQSMITTYTDSSMILNDMSAAINLVQNSFTW